MFLRLRFEVLHNITVTLYLLSLDQPGSRCSELCFIICINRLGILLPNIAYAEAITILNGN